MSAAAGLRLVCYCLDCQIYAFHLGRADEMLDPYGGTEVFQTVPRRVTIRSGREHLRCLRQSPKGVLRWYAGCCRTALANGLPSASVPFASLVQPIMDLEASGRSRVLGPVRGAAYLDSARGTPPYPRAGRALLATIGWRMLVAYLRGEQRPSPFYGDDGRPAVEAEPMSSKERNRLREHVRGLGAR